MYEHRSQVCPWERAMSSMKLGLQFMGASNICRDKGIIVGCRITKITLLLTTKSVIKGGVLD